MNITCSDCGNPASVEIIPGCFLCDACEAVLKYVIEESRAEYCCGPLAVSPVTKHSPARMSDCRRDHNSRGYAAVNAGQLGCEGNRLSRQLDRNEELWTAVGVTAGETAQIIQNAAQSLSDRSPAPASAAMPGSIEQAAEANQQGSHSSDVEQPHCRRTRADSSPAASTKFEYPDLPDFLKRGAA